MADLTALRLAAPDPKLSIVAMEADVRGGVLSARSGRTLGAVRADAQFHRKGDVKRVLFVCSQNRLRSPTAEQVFSTWPGIEVASAGLNDDAETPVTAELLEWAQIIFVMEKAHRNRLSKKFRASINGQRVICLDIPDEYEFMDAELVKRLQAAVPRYLPRR